MRLFCRGLVCAAVLLVGCAAGGSSGSGRFSFALVADAPYSASQARAFDALIDQVNADEAVQFVLHAGDIKGGERCSDALLRERIVQLQRFDKPVIYTPGDNEWADCHTRAAGHFDPLERLAYLRRLAFANPHRSLGRRSMALVTQGGEPDHAAFVENTRFTFRRVVFAAIHVAGSNNGLRPWNNSTAWAAEAGRSVGKVQYDAFVERQSAALAWLDAAFAQAKAQHAAAVVVLIHANLRFDLGAGSAARAGFERFIERLRALAASFARPVLLAHGDHHYYIIDRPLAGEDATSDGEAELIRVQTVGSPLVGWVRVTVDPQARQPFSFSLQL